MDGVLNILLANVMMASVIRAIVRETIHLWPFAQFMGFKEGFKEGSQVFKFDEIWVFRRLGGILMRCRRSVPLCSTGCFSRSPLSQSKVPAGDCSTDVSSL